MAFGSELLRVVAPLELVVVPVARQREAERVAETALVVLVPEAEALVADYRLLHDPAAAVGVPAHVTILYPFRSIVDDLAAEAVAEIAAEVGAFDVAFATLARFPGEVVYLVPQPAEPFRRLSEASVTRFPDCPPYGGAIPDPVPHLTVADGVDTATAAALDSAVAPGLPIRSRVEHLTLIAQDETGHWFVVRHWPLGRVDETTRTAPDYRPD
jgi:2'-5' RNA ligase